MSLDWRALASIQTLAALQYFPIVGFNNERRNHAEHDLRAPANKKYRPISPFRPQRLGRPTLAASTAGDQFAIVIHVREPYF
jgi:hypothetical protein